MKESREGIAVSELEIKRLDSIISPLLLKGQSMHHIYENHRAELMVSERTLYSYVSDGLFSARNIDMPRVVRMSPRRKKPDTIKIDPKCREGRKREDFIVFMKEHPDTPLVELDSVEGIRGGAVLLTITFVHTGLQLAYWRQANDSQSVTDIFAKLYFELGPVDFMRLFPSVLRTTEANSLTRRRSSSTRTVISARMFFTATQALLTRREAAKCGMK